jgi:hypothetical protein
MRIIGLMLLAGVAFILLFIIQNYILPYVMAVVCALIRAESYSTRWLILVTTSNGIVLYLFVGLLARLILQTRPLDNSTPLFLFYAIVSSLFLYGLTVRSLIAKSGNEAYEDDRAYNYSYRSRLQRIDLIKSYLVVPVFILTLFFNPLAFNPLIDLLFNACRWALSLSYVGILIGVAGLWMSASILFYGVVGGVGLVVAMLTRDE